MRRNSLNYKTESIPDLATLKSVKREHLFMLCAWNSGEGPSKVRSPTERGSTPEIKKKNTLQMVQSELFWSVIWE